MKPPLEALLIGLAAPLGSALILWAAAFAALKVARRIHPRTEASIEEAKRLDAEIATADANRGRNSLDSSHHSLPAFAITFAIALPLASWGSAAAHLRAPEAGAAWEFAARALLSALVLALIAGLIGGLGYQRWFNLKSILEQQRVLDENIERDRNAPRYGLRSLRRRYLRERMRRQRREPRKRGPRPDRRRY